jgi:hypothetical protein
VEQELVEEFTLGKRLWEAERPKGRGCVLLHGDDTLATSLLAIMGVVCIFLFLTRMKSLSVTLLRNAVCVECPGAVLLVLASKCNGGVQLHLPLRHHRECIANMGKLLLYHLHKTSQATYSRNIVRLPSVIRANKHTSQRTVPSRHASLSHHQPGRRVLHTTGLTTRTFPLVQHLPGAHIRNMSSDADYASFLDKANQDISSAESQNASQKKNRGTQAVNTGVPKVLEQVEEYYVSDADEPFEPVALKFNGSSISAGRQPTFRKADLMGFCRHPMEG